MAEITEDENGNSYFIGQTASGRLNSAVPSTTVTTVERLKKKLEIVVKALTDINEASSNTDYDECRAIVQIALTDIGMLDREEKG